MQNWSHFSWENMKRPLVEHKEHNLPRKLNQLYRQKITQICFKRWEFQPCDCSDYSAVHLNFIGIYQNTSSSYKPAILQHNTLIKYVFIPLNWNHYVNCLTKPRFSPYFEWKTSFSGTGNFMWHIQNISNQW